MESPDIASPRKQLATRIRDAEVVMAVDAKRRPRAVADRSSGKTKAAGWPIAKGAVPGAFRHRGTAPFPYRSELIANADLRSPDRPGGDPFFGGKRNIAIVDIGDDILPGRRIEHRVIQGLADRIAADLPRAAVQQVEEIADARIDDPPATHRAWDFDLGVQVKLVG